MGNEMEMISKIFEWFGLKPQQSLFILICVLLALVFVKIDYICSTNLQQTQDIKGIKTYYVTNENIKEMNKNLRYLMERSYTNLKELRVDVNKNSKEVYILKGKLQ